MAGFGTMVSGCRKLMLGQPASLLARVVVGITTLTMFGAAAAMLA